MDRVEPAALTRMPPGSSAATVRATLAATLGVLAFAALVHLARYVLLITNRNTLLRPAVAATGVWLGMLASAAAIVAVIVSAVLLTRWLIARRAATFAHHGRPEPHSTRALWVGSLTPLVNLVWAPVYVIELANAEEHYVRLRKPIVVWWIAWILSTAASIFATATSWASDAQGIANNAVAMTFAYLFAMAAVSAAAKVFEGFEHKPVDRPAHRWVVVADDRHAPAASAAALESKGQVPAA